MRSYIDRRWTVLAAVLAAVALTISTPTLAQAIVRVYGTFSGGPIPLASDSSGRLQVTIAGGTATPAAVQTDSLCMDKATHDTCLQRTAAGKISLTGTTPMIQLGGTTSSFPAWKQSSARIQGRLADDSGYAAVDAISFSSQGAGLQLGLANDAFFIGASTKLLMNTAVSSPSSCGTSPSVTNSNGTAVFVVTGGTGGSATGCTITMPTATNGWMCSVVNITQVAAHRADRATVFTGSTTTSATWEYVTVSTGAATAFTASDVFRGICFAY